MQRGISSTSRAIEGSSSRVLSDVSGMAAAVDALWSTLGSHPAQSSIGWDVIWTLGSFLAWIVLAPLS